MCPSTQVSRVFSRLARILPPGYASRLARVRPHGYASRLARVRLHGYASRLARVRRLSGCASRLAQSGDYLDRPNTKNADQVACHLDRLLD